MSINKIINFDTAGKENEELLKENFDRFKTEASRSINIKNYSSNSYKSSSSYYQPSGDLIKRPIIKSPGFHYHASQFIRHISFMTLEVNPSSNSKMVGCHSLCLLPISINKQDMATIQSTQSRKSQHL